MSVLSSRRYPSHSKRGNRRRKRAKNILSACAKELGRCDSDKEVAGVVLVGSQLTDTTGDTLTPGLH